MKEQPSVGLESFFTVSFLPVDTVKHSLALLIQLVESRKLLEEVWLIERAK